MATLLKLLFFFLVLVILGAGGYAQPDFEQTLRLAQQGHVEFQHLLGFKYELGEGVPKDLQEAVKWFRKAAEQGHAGAQHLLGFKYELGEGVPRDYQEAFKWHSKAANQGNAGSQNNLGRMYAFGEGVPRDYVLAHMWRNLALFKVADEAGTRKRKARWLDDLEENMTTEQIAEAQRLAREWKPKGNKETAKWYRMAADRGYAPAQYELGVIYLNGQGFPSNLQESAKWFRKAADQGHASAQYSLGVAYSNGRGVPRDFVLAHMWWNLSLSKETDDDMRNKKAEWLDDLEGKMAQKQISEAQRLAREFKPKARF